MVCGRHGCGHHGHYLWPSWSLFVAVMVIVCGRHCLWPSWFVAIIIEPQCAEWLEDVIVMSLFVL